MFLSWLYTLGREESAKTKAEMWAPRIVPGTAENPDVWAESGDWAEVYSSNVARIAYHWARTSLLVWFRSGRLYVYYGVSPEAAKEMFNSSSMGKYVWKLRRAQVPVKELTHPP